MALGRKSRTVDTTTAPEVVANDGSPDYTEKNGEYYDPEANNETGRKKSVIASGVIGDADDASLTVGKQLELEATNSIKYRTCSWQKVMCSFLITSIPAARASKARQLAARHNHPILYPS